MGDNESREELFDENEKKVLNYSAYYNDLIVREQPFYRKGMGEEEKKKEEEYLNSHMEAFYDGKYVPLWKQAWFK